MMVQPDHLIPARQGGSRRCIVWSSLGGEEQSRRGSDMLTGAEEVPGLWVEKPQTRRNTGKAGEKRDIKQTRSMADERALGDRLCCWKGAIAAVSHYGGVLSDSTVQQPWSYLGTVLYLGEGRKAPVPYLAGRWDRGARVVVCAASCGGPSSPVCLVSRPPVEVLR